MQLGENSKFPVPPCKQKGLDPISSIQHLRLPQSKHLALKANRVCIQETYKTIEEKETVLGWLSRTHCPERDLFAYIKSCSLRLRLLIQHSSKNKLQSSQQTTFPSLPCGPHQITIISQEELLHTSGTRTFKRLPPRECIP